MAERPVAVPPVTGREGVMRKYQIIPHPRIMSRPCCEICDTEMWLVSIEPDDKPDHDRRTFECPRCQHQTIEVIKYK
jgi:hypothetical protein